MYTFTTEFESFARGFLSCPRDDLSLRMAYGLLGAAKEQHLVVDTELGLCYATQTQNCGYEYGKSLYCEEDGIKRLIEENPDDAADLEYIIEGMKPYMPFTQKYFTPKNIEYLDGGTLWGGTWYGHCVPNLADAALYGTDHIRNKVAVYREKNPGKDDFYDSILVTMDAIDTLGARFHDIADRMLEEVGLDDAQKRRVEIIKNTFTHAPKAPCLDFPEACIVYTVMHTFDGIDSPGHFDQYMYDLWSKTEPALRREYLENIWQFFHNTRTWNLCIGGSDENWNDLTNDLSIAILEVTAKYKFQTPNLTMRCHRNTGIRASRRIQGDSHGLRYAHILQR